MLGFQHFQGVVAEWNITQQACPLVLCVTFTQQACPPVFTQQACPLVLMAKSLASQGISDDLRYGWKMRYDCRLHGGLKRHLTEVFGGGGI